MDSRGSETEGVLTPVKEPEGDAAAVATAAARRPAAAAIDVAEEKIDVVAAVGCGELPIRDGGGGLDGPGRDQSCEL